MVEGAVAGSSTGEGGYGARAGSAPQPYPTHQKTEILHASDERKRRRDGRQKAATADTAEGWGKGKRDDRLWRRQKPDTSEGCDGKRLKKSYL